MVGSTLTFVQTATNSAGSATGTSASTATVIAAAPTTGIVGYVNFNTKAAGVALESLTPDTGTIVRANGLSTSNTGDDASAYTSPTTPVRARSATSTRGSTWYTLGTASSASQKVTAECQFINVSNNINYGGGVFIGYGGGAATGWLLDYTSSGFRIFSYTNGSFPTPVTIASAVAAGSTITMSLTYNPSATAGSRLTAVINGVTSSPISEASVTTPGLQAGLAFRVGTAQSDTVGNLFDSCRVTLG